MKSVMYIMMTMGFLFYGVMASAQSYALSTFLDLGPNSAFAAANCPNKTCNIEGNAVDPNDGSVYVTFASPAGQIYKIKPNGAISLFASFDVPNDDPNITFAATAFRLLVDKQGNVWTAFRNVDSNQTPTAMNGLWKIPSTGGYCQVGAGPCTKIWPANYQSISPQVRFLDGVALDQKNGYAYVGDAQMGNIWKVNTQTGAGSLWAGTDFGNNPNYLMGDPHNFLLGSPLSGRGLGVIALAMDTQGQNVYASNFDNGQVIQIPIKADGSAGTQKLLMDLSANDQQLDALTIDKNNVLRVTMDQVKFKEFTNYLGCYYGVPGFTCPVPFVNLADGHQVLSASVSNPANVLIQPLLNDPLLGVATGVNLDTNSNNLYIDVYSTQDGSGARIVKATPTH